jgi:transcriptional regulator with XRE-family HTH domain
LPSCGAAEYQRALASAIGSRIREKRQQLGLTQEQVRAQMELENVYVSRTQYSRVENGESLPNAAEIIAMTKVLHVSFNWLMTGQENM